jgi:alpha-tubulin suppressor-like RCC1 family protein
MASTWRCRVALRTATPHQRGGGGLPKTIVEVTTGYWSFLVPPSALRLLSYVALLASGLPLVACNAAFTSDTQPKVSVEAVGSFPDTLRHTDTATLAVRVTDQSMRELAGAGVKWVSSDTSILQVLQDTAATGSSPQDALLAGLHAKVRARGIGSVTITITIVGGTGAASTSAYQKTVKILELWIAVAAGAIHTCAVNVDSVAFCWGAGGTLGNGGLASSATPIRVSGLSGLRAVEVSAGRAVSCIRDIGGLVYCWGDNAHGEVGDGSLNPQYAAGLGGSGQVYTMVSVGGHHTCGTLGPVGAVQCWGETSLGQLGEGRTSSSVDCDFIVDVSFKMANRKCTLSPDHFVQVGGTSAVVPVMITSGGLHSCAVRKSLVSDKGGPVVCWGLSTVGQLGRTPPYGAPFLNAPHQCTADQPQDTFPCFDYAVAVDGGRIFSSVSAGWDDKFQAHTCAITMSDSLGFCWGRNDQGQLGTSYVDTLPCIWDASPSRPSAPRGSAKCSRSPVVVAAPLKFATIGAGARHTCALSALDQLVYCWGDDSLGQLGDGSTAARPKPQRVAGALAFGAVSVGAYHSCGITLSKGALYCWGNGSSGQLGAGSYTSSPVPVRVVEPSP